MKREDCAVNLALRVHGSKPLNNVRLRIRNVDGRPEARLQDDAGLADIAYTIDSESGEFNIGRLKKGRYHIVVTAFGIVPERLDVVADGPMTLIEVELAAEGDRYYYRLGRRQFIEEENLWAVPSPGDAEPHRQKRMAEFDIDAVVDDVTLGERHRVRLIRMPKDGGHVHPEEATGKAAGAKVAEDMFPVVEITPERITMLFGTAVIQFCDHLVWSDILTLVRERGGSILHSVFGSPRTYVVALEDMTDRRNIVDLCNDLHESGHTEFSEPYTIGTVEHTQIHPQDFLRPQQWNLDLVRLPHAWERLRNYSQNILGVPQTDNRDITYGSPDVIISIYDSGIYSQTVGGVTTARNSDLNGNVKGGAGKVHRFFDFRSRTTGGATQVMVANNDIPVASHGSHCAGVAAALTDLNAPPGLTGGVVGASPGSRLIGGLWDGTVMAVYHFHRSWEFIAGFNPQWGADGVNYAAGETFFAAVAAGQLGAWIFSHSHNFPGGNADTTLAINNTVCYGRNRRGGMFMFAAANGDQDILADHAVGNHRRAIMVAATTLNHLGEEIRASYSNFHVWNTFAGIVPAPGSTLPKPGNVGPAGNADRIGIEFAAPSHNWYERDGAGVGHVNHNPPENRGVFTSGLLDPPIPMIVPVNDSTTPGATPIVIFRLQVLVPPPPVPTNTIVVNDDPSFATIGAGTRLLIGDPAIEGGMEVVQVAAPAVRDPLPPNDITITLTANLAMGHPVNTNVHVIFCLVTAVPDPRVAPPVLTNTIVVNDDPAFAAIVPGWGVLIGNPTGGDATESAQVLTVVRAGAPPNNITITLTGNLNNGHPVNTPVFFGPRTHAEDFGGTSSACPLAAGIAALVLAIRPTLTNYEVREILRTTADPVDIRECRQGRWRGTAAHLVGPPDPVLNPLLNVVDAGGLMQNFGIGNVTLAAGTAVGATDITVVGSRGDFHLGQAILIGAETRVRVAIAGPVATPFNLQVDSKVGFVVGQQVRIGAAYSAFLAGTRPGNEIRLNHTRGFRVGDQLTISGANYTITAILDSRWIRLNVAYAGPYAFPQIPPIPVVRQFSDTRTITAIPPAAGDLWITVGAAGDPPIAGNYRVGDVIEVVGTEIAIVKGLPVAPAQRIDVSRLVNAHPIAGAAVHVRGGLKPYYSTSLGFGRVNADAAVQAAIDYDHEARDLMIRNDLADNGRNVFVVAPGAQVNSPDLWVRNVSLATEGASATPAGYPSAASYAVPGPHRNAVRGAANWLYARVRNRGNALESLDASVRFYIALRNRVSPLPTSTDFLQTSVPFVGPPVAGTSPFRDWALNTDSTTQGTQFLGEAFLYDLPVTPAVPGFPVQPRGIAAGGTRIVSVQWPAAQTPPAVPIGTPIANRMRVFMLAEVLPHDGVMRDAAGTVIPDSLVIGENNNITYKEISFATVQIRNGVGGVLVPNSIDSGRSGLGAPYAIRIEIADTFGYFMAENISVELSIRSAPAVGPPAPVRQTVVFKNGVGGWGFDPGFGIGVAAWATMNRPQLNPVGGNAVGAAVDVTMDGTITIGSRDDQISIRVLINSESGAGMVDSSIAAAIRPTPVNYSDDDINGVPGLGLFAFADTASLPVQADELAFGAKSETMFRLTSGFEPVADVPVYAPMSGTLLVQRVSDGLGGYDADLVNVIIKPSERTTADVPSLEYVVLRGVRLDSFFTIDQGTGALGVRPRAGASELVTMIYRHHDARLAAFNANTALASAHPELRPNEPIGVELFGWLPAIDGTTELDEYFNGKDRTVQLLYVPAGMQIGQFAAGPDAGVEFLAEGGVFLPTLDFARKRSHSIDFEEAPYDALTGLAALHAREEVLSFIDPAAYYGLHCTYGVRKRDGTDYAALSGADLYGEIVARFATRNTVYFDVRNENNYSLTYYGNYNPDGVQMRVGSSAVNLVDAEYRTLGWPICMVQRTAEAIAGGDAEQIYVALPTADNRKPAVHVSAGMLTSARSARTVSDDELYLDGEEWSRELALRTTQVDDGAGGKLDVASLVRMHYCRRVDDAYVWDASSTVPKFERYTDNLFGPIGASDGWELPNDSPTRWVNLRDRLFVDGMVTAPSLEFGSVVERGIAFQEGQILMFNAAMDIKADTSTSFSPISAIGSINGGFSVQPGFMQAAGMLSRMKKLTATIKDTPVVGGNEVSVSLIRLEPEQQPLSAAAFMMLGVDDDQYTAMKNAAATLSEYHHRNLILEKDAAPGGAPEFTDTSNGIKYHRYTVKVRGLNAEGISTDAVPAQTVKVYSMDGLAFVSSAFVMPQLVPPAYVPDHEESVAFSKPQPMALISADAVIKTDYEQFGTALRSPLTVSKADLQSLVRTYGQRVIDHARIRCKTIRDDRPLYWARLRMATELKGHPYCLAHKADCDALAAEFEDISRGRGDTAHSGVDFSLAAGRRRILISGFDPFELGSDPLTSNPSGAVALALHGEDLASPGGRHGYVQSVLFPVRFRDFDAGGIEAFFKKYLYDDAVDMIVTISMNGPHPTYDIERMLSRYRNPNLLDNNDEYGKSPIGSGSKWKEFYETKLPAEQMMANVTLGAPGQSVFFNQSFQSSGGAGGPQEVNRANAPVAPGPNIKTKVTSAPFDSIQGRAMRGSGGTYLSNEIAYRVARLRDEPPVGIATGSEVPTGHLHIPGVVQIGGGKTIDDIVTATRELIANGLDGLHP